MSKLVSEYVTYAEKRGEHMEKMGGIYEDVGADSKVRGHDRGEEREVKKRVQNGRTVGRCYRLAAVCVILLCVLLLTAVIVLWIKFNTLNTEKDQLQTSYNTLTSARDQLETRYNDMKNERNQFKFQKDQLLIHRDQLQQETSDLQNVLLKFGWRFFSTSVHKIFMDKKNWSESRKACKERGADLVIINSTEKQEFISKYFGYKQAWIGLTDTQKENDFKWVDGTPLGTPFWWDGEPNNYENNEDCVITGFTHDVSNISTWADYPCNLELFRICEIEILK